MNRPDPLFSGALTDPQGWNRYAYVRNNPLMFNDPPGAQQNAADFGDFWSGFCSAQNTCLAVYSSASVWSSGAAMQSGSGTPQAGISIGYAIRWSRQRLMLRLAIPAAMALAGLIALVWPKTVQHWLGSWAELERRTFGFNNPFLSFIRSDRHRRYVRIWGAVVFIAALYVFCVAKPSG
jgi:hypothetical protein